MPVPVLQHGRMLAACTLFTLLFSLMGVGSDAQAEGRVPTNPLFVYEYGGGGSTSQSAACRARYQLHVNSDDPSSDISTTDFAIHGQVCIVFQTYYRGTWMERPAGNLYFYPAPSPPGLPCSEADAALGRCAFRAEYGVFWYPTGEEACQGFAEERTLTGIQDGFLDGQKRYLDEIWTVSSVGGSTASPHCTHSIQQRYTPPGGYWNYATQGRWVERRNRSDICPANSKLDGKSCLCDEGYAPGGAPGAEVCEKYVNVARASTPAPSCASPMRGNPIEPLRGVKRETVDTGLRLGALPLTFTFDSTAKVPRSAPGLEGASNGLSVRDGVLGELWFSSFHRRVAGAVNSGSTAQPGAAHAHRGNGRAIAFSSSSGSFMQEPIMTDRLLPVTGGYRYVDTKSGAQETYDSEGRITQIRWTHGAGVDFTYSDASTPVSVAPAAGYLIAATDDRSRTFSFRYGARALGGAALLKSVSDGVTTLLVLSYDTSDRLTGITWADGSTRGFVYDHPSLPWAMTGIVDENGRRHSHYGYDETGIAVFTERAGGVDRYSVSYASAPRVVVTTERDAASGVNYRYHDWQAPSGVVVTGPNGSSAWEASTLHGKAFLTSSTQAAGAGCAASTKATTYDANGNPSSEDDFNGARTCRVFDASRNLATTAVEGLSNTVACATVTPVNAVLPAGSRKTSTQWHPDWSLPSKRAEPGRLTTYVYNGRPDPFASNAIASCAPGSAVLPDGNPIAVLCKQVEQATTDVDGSKGFGATLQAGVVNRVWTYTYNARGQMLTAKSPRTDVNETTTFSYYEDTTAEHTLGDLKTVSNAKGQPTQYPLYNKAGQALRVIDVNNVATEYVYDARQRIKSATTAGATTGYDYHPTGLIKRVTQPDMTYVEFTYDDAHRLTGIRDSQGNSIEYTLDAGGQRTAERHLDPSGVLARSISRVIDALGRVQRLKEGE